MVEYKNYARNSLQTRLDRSRRYRSRGGGGHNDAGSVGDASVASVDNVAAVSATSNSVDHSVKSKDAPVTQRHVQADCISKALRTDDSTSSARDDFSQHSASLSVGESGKSISRRQRLALKSYRHKGSDIETSYPTKAAAPARDIGTGEEKNISRTQENPVKANAPTSILTQNSVTQQTMKRRATIATPSTINTDSQDNLASEVQQPNRYFHSPKHSLNSPCESMAYQTSAMEEECDKEDQATMSRSSSSINYSNSPGRNHTPSALHSWKQREQREKTTETGNKNPASRGNRVVVTPKTFQGQPGMRSGSNDSYQPSWSGNNMQMDNHKPKKSLPTGISCASPPQTMKKPVPSVLVAPHLRKTAHLSPSYQQRHSTGGNGTSPHHERFSQPRSPDGSMYKNILKPVRRDRDGTSNPTEKAAFGGVIETPKSIKVSSLLASFDSHQNQPLMPMNSKDPRIRQSLPHSGLYATPKKASRKSDAQEFPKKDNKFVNEKSRQIVVHPPGRHSFSSARSSVHQYPPDAESVQSIDSTSIRSSQTNSSSPSKSGVAEKYRNVTGRVMKGEHSEVFAIEECHEEDQQKEDSHGQVTERVRQYYKASWKVQTNDFNDEKKCSDSIQSDNETLSPRQSVLSSWNQKYREQAQSVSRLEQQEISEEPSLSEKEETVSNGPSSVSTPSIFSMWQQRDNDHQQIPAASLPIRDTTPIKPHLKEVLTISETTSDRKLVDERVGSEIVPITDEVSIPCKVGNIDIALPSKKNGQNSLAENPESTIQMRLEDSSSRSPHQDSKHSPLSPAEREDNEDTLDDSQFGSSVGEQQTHAARRMKKNDQTSSSYPWYKDTKHSVIQSWQTRTSLPKVESIIREEETDPFKQSSKIQESEELREDDPSRSKSGRVPSPFNPSDFIDEKKSGDLSVDEDKILGLDDSENIGLNRQRTSSSNNLEDDLGLKVSSQQLIYENDSYISNAESEKEDTFSDKMQQFPSKTGSGRSGGSSVDLKQIDSEDISLYVEDDFAKKSSKITTTRQNQNEKIEAVVDSHVMKEVVDNGASVRVESSERNRASLIHPSPKDSKNYRKGYFGDESPSKMLETPGAKVEGKTRHSCEKIVPVKASGRTGTRNKTDAVDIWAISSVSEDEVDGDIQFDDTDEWLARDPDVKAEEIDDSSIMSDMIEETNRTSMISSNPFVKEAPQIQEFDINENTIDSSKTWNLTENDVVTGKEEHKLQDIATIPVLENPNTWTPSKELPIKNTKESQNVDNQAAFDPFLEEDEDDKEKKNDVPAELFSPNPDPFMTEEAFSPLDWSSPRGTTAQHIGYYNSPDSRLEI